MRCVQELTFGKWDSIIPQLLPDGWCPLSVRPGPGEYMVTLAILVDPAKPAEAETFYMLNQGDALPEQPDGKELAFIGDCQNGRYLFLQVDAPEAPGTRFVGRY